jgi:hypothetical protein
LSRKEEREHHQASRNTCLAWFQRIQPEAAVWKYFAVARCASRVEGDQGAHKRDVRGQRIG